MIPAIYDGGNMSPISKRGKPVDNSTTYHVDNLAARSTAKKPTQTKKARGGRGEAVGQRAIIHPSLSTKKQKAVLSIGIDQQILELELELAGIQRKKCEYIETHKIEYFTPLPHQESFLAHVRSGKKTVLIVGANQIGKTVLCGNLGGVFSMGCKAPWDGSEMFPSDFARQNGGRKVLGKILCQDWEKAAKENIVPKLKEWLPAGSYETRKNNVGIESEFIFPKTGSRFNLLTYKEDTKSHEGGTFDWVHADEPPPRDKYIANRRGLVARNGIFTMAMTAISEPWILDEIVLDPDVSTGIVADIPIQANTHLTEEAIRIFESSLTEDEKVARIQGGWLQLTGRIWKGFDPMVHRVAPFDIPPDWPVEFQIDFHLSTPHAVSFCAVDPFNRYFVCDEIWENCSSEELADKIARLKIQKVWRMKYGEIDALSKGDSAYIRNRFGAAEDSFTMIERRLAKHHIRLGVGSKDEKSYIKAVEARLKGPNGMPTLYIFDTCPNTLKQVQRWAYDDKGTPKSDGHFPECLGRFTQSGLKYRPLVNNVVPIAAPASPLLAGLRQTAQIAR